MSAAGGIREICETSTSTGLADFLPVHISRLELVLLSALRLLRYAIMQSLMTMQCRYRWLKDGQPLDVDSAAGISQRPGKGTITIEIDQLQSHHDGEYQCIASNAFGTAVSVKSLLKRASKCHEMRDRSLFRYIVVVIFCITRLFS